MFYSSGNVCKEREKKKKNSTPLRKFLINTLSKKVGAIIFMYTFSTACSSLGQGQAASLHFYCYQIQSAEIAVGPAWGESQDATPEFLLHAEH